MRFTRFVRRIILLAALPLLLLAIPAVSAATASAATGTGWIRLAHLSPNTPAVDVYLYSFGDSSAQIVLHHVAYGTVSPYEQVPAGDYTVAMRAAGAAATSAPVLSASVDVTSGRAYTVAGLGPESGLRLQVLDDQLATPSGKALVRVIQASLKQSVVSVNWGGQVLNGSLKFGSVSSYQTVSPGHRDPDRQRRRRAGDRQRPARGRHRAHAGGSRRREGPADRRPARRGRQRHRPGRRGRDRVRRDGAARPVLPAAVAGGDRRRAAARGGRRPAPSLAPGSRPGGRRASTGFPPRGRSG